MSAQSDLRIHEEDGSIFVEFAPDAERVGGRSIRMVLDFNSTGEVIGIEIINLVFKAGKKSLDIINQFVPIKGELPRYSYDQDSDSFYLRLKADRSLDQKALDGSMFLDREGRINALSAKWK